MIGEFARFYQVGLNGALKMPLGRFFLFLTAMPELRRREQAEQANLRLLTGSRGLLDDDDFNSAFERLNTPLMKKPVPVDPEKLEALQNVANKLNQAFG